MNDDRVAQFTISIDTYDHETTMTIVAAAMTGMLVLEAGPGSYRRETKKPDYIRYVVWHPNLPRAKPMFRNGRVSPQVIALHFEAVEGSNASQWIVVWRKGGEALWGMTVDLAASKPPSNVISVAPRRGSGSSGQANGEGPLPQ